MPIYEFYCDKCNTIFNFFSRSINTEKVPPCPRDDAHTLSRKISRFAALSGSRKGDAGEGDDPLANLPLDESKMESAMASLASEAEKINEDDPRQAAKLMQKFSDMTGLKYNDKIQDALSRMEAGEDPESLEQDMEDAMGEDENPFVMSSGSGKRNAPPAKDDTLYEM
ncbi:MAG: zinc ribbon domain-containing protein [Chitinivibrionales bacterium]|nr:zinc ribbon domain-containing protein [Chitinivibrionales bacterium]